MRTPPAGLPAGSLCVRACPRGRETGITVDRSNDGERETEMARTNGVAAAAAGLLLLGGAAAAEEATTAKLTENEVRSFVGRMIDEAEAAAESGAWKSATDWMRENFAADGSFVLRGAVVSAGRAPFSYDATLDGADIEAFAAMDQSPFAAALSAISDYSAIADVAYVDLLPNGEASAEVEIREKAMLDLARLSGAVPDEVEEAAEEAGGGIAVHSTSTCQLRLVEREGGGVMIRLGACVTTTTF